MRRAGVYTLADLRTFGSKQGWCPYFLARHMMSFTNVIVYNYQYMIDPKVRSNSHLAFHTGSPMPLARPRVHARQSSTSAELPLPPPALSCPAHLIPVLLPHTSHLSIAATRVSFVYCCPTRLIRLLLTHTSHLSIAAPHISFVYCCPTRLICLLLPHTSHSSIAAPHISFVYC
eukprot:363429-Chlamydomonas_euryale.AAC.1